MNYELDKAARRSVVRRSTLEEQGSLAEYAALTPEQRVLMVWPLTLTAWSFKQPDGFQRRLPRHIARVERRRS